MTARQDGPIVVGVDGSEAAVRAAAWAAREAVLSHDALRLVTVVPADPGTGRAVESVRAEEHLDAAEQVVGRHAGSLQVGRDVRSGSAAEELIEESGGAHMLVLASRGLGETGAGLSFGSTAEAAIAHAHCPVAVVRSEPVEPAAGKVVVGVDAAGVSRDALGWAFDAAALHGAPLLVVHTWQETGVDGRAVQASGETAESVAQRMLTECIGEWRARFPDVPVSSSVEQDRPVRALLRHAERARLLVVGSRGRGGFTGMLIGSTSRALAHCAPCPLLVVRSGATAG